MSGAVKVFRPKLTPAVELALRAWARENHINPTAAVNYLLARQLQMAAT
jgi:hypothetical protein